MTELDARRLALMLEMLARLRRRSVPLRLDQLSDVDEFDLAIFRISVIAEEAGKLSPEIRLRHTMLPWAEMRVMRNIIVHTYEEVERRIVYQTLQNDLNPIEAMCRAELAANP